MKVWQSILAAFKSPRAISQAKANQVQAEAKEFFDKLTTTRKITPPDTPLILGSDETALLNEPSRLLEGRSTRVSGQSSSVQRLKELDSGTLTLTTKRLVFTGSMESRVVSLKDIVSVEAIPDAIEVSTGKRAKRQIYSVHNPVIWTTLVRTVVKGGLSATVIEPVDPSADIRFSCP